MQQRRRSGDAKYWYGESAAKGNRFALSQLPTIYTFERDDEKAAYWYRRGAEAGMSSSQYELAARLVKGTGVAKDEQEAIRWLTVAADQAHPYACYALAQRHADGIGVNQDSVQAYALAHVAESTIDSGDFSAVAKINELMETLASQMSAAQLQQAKPRSL